MKKTLIASAAVLLAALTACTKDDSGADFTVLREIEVTNNGVPYTAAGTRLLYIFDAAGNRVANYEAGQKFALDNGTYQIFGVTPTFKVPTGTMITDQTPNATTTITPFKLEDLVLPQSVNGTDTLTISDVVTYSVPNDNKLRVDMTTRTGRFGFISLDTKPEIGDSYNRVVVVAKVKRVGYRIADGTFVEGEMSVTAEQNTNAGMGVRQLMALFPTDSEANDVELIIECYKDTELVRTMTFPRKFRVEAHKNIAIGAYLNGEDPSLINDFTVMIIDDPWTTEPINLLPPLVPPAGYTLVPKGGDIGSYINGVESAEPIKLMLTPGSTYNFDGNVTIKSSVHILAGKIEGESRPLVSMSRNFLIDGAGVKSVVFEGTDFVTTSDYLFNNSGSAVFALDEFKLIDCTFKDFKRSIFRIQQGTAGMNTVEKMVIDSCNFIGFGAGNYALLRGNGDNNIFKDVEFKNSSVSFVAGETKPLIESTNGVTSAMKVVIDYCTFSTVSAQPLFDMRVGAGGAMDFTLSNSLFTGENPTQGVRTSGGSTYTYIDNYCTTGWLPAAGVFATAPTEAGAAGDLFADAANRDFTIKDKSSAVYLKFIGDPRWIDQPRPPFAIPVGYKLIASGGDIRREINGVEGATPINLLLEPGGVYSITGGVVVKSNVHILAAKQAGKARPVVNMTSNFQIDGAGVKSVVFEGTDFVTTSDYLFNNGTGVVFALDEFKLLDCTFKDFKRSIFRIQGATETNSVEKMVVDNCNFINYGAGGYAMFTTRNNNNIYKDVELKNSTFSFATGANKPIFEGSNSVTTPMKVVVANCTYNAIASAPVFDMRVGEGGAMDFSLSKSLFTGENPSRGIQTSDGSTYAYTDNYCTAGWLPAAGVFATAPTETAVAADLFVDPAARDFTVKDKVSAVYTGRIGDPRWIK